MYQFAASADRVINWSFDAENANLEKQAMPLMISYVFVDGASPVISFELGWGRELEPQNARNLYDW